MARVKADVEQCKLRTGQTVPMPARDVRIGVLYGMPHRTLVEIWRREVGPGAWTKHSPRRWTKDELIDSIIRHEFGPITL